MNFVKKLFKNDVFASLLLCIILILILSISSPFFFNVFNLESLQTSIAPSVIIAIGMMILLITGNFDLSVGSIMALSGVITSIFISVLGWPVVPAILVGILCGAVMGLINGILVAVIGINPLIATIGTMYIFRGLTEVVLVGDGGLYASLSGFPETFINFGTGKILGIYYMFWIMIILVIIAELFIKLTFRGKTLYYIGGNEEAAKLMGINVKKTKIWAYVLSGVLSSFAGIISTARYQMANRYLGEGIHMSVIISCIIGGGSLGGGKGSILGGLFGVTFMSLINNSFNLFEINTRWQNVVVGFILIVVVLIDGYLYLKKQKASGKI